MSSSVKGQNPFLVILSRTGLQKVTGLAGWLRAPWPWAAAQGAPGQRLVPRAGPCTKAQENEGFSGRGKPAVFLQPLAAEVFSVG